MLFSKPDIAKYLNDNFECAWQELRPVPQVKIDFGNGRVLHRTLAGNVATWITTRDGMSVDVIPALATPETYVARLKEARALHARIASLEPAKALLELQAWHAKKAKAPKAQQKLTSRLANRAQRLEAARPAGLRLLSKSRVERPIKKSFLVQDNDYNTTKRQPLAHKMLANNPGLQPSAMTNAFFNSILNVNLLDPYLGLAPYVLGGEPGRG